MASRIIEVVGLCEHGNDFCDQTIKVQVPGETLWKLCPGGSRRVLTEGELVDLIVGVLHDHGAVKAASGNWVDVPDPKRCPRADAHYGSAQRILDALAGGES